MSLRIYFTLTARAEAPASRACCGRALGLRAADGESPRWEIPDGVDRLTKVAQAILDGCQ